VLPAAHCSAFSSQDKAGEISDQRWFDRALQLTKDTAPSAQLEGGDVDVRPAAVAADIADATIGGEVPGSGEEDAAGGDKGKAKQPLRKRKLPEAIPGPVGGGKRGEGEGQLESRQTQAVQVCAFLQA
jgi:hypothetical protein